MAGMNDSPMTILAIYSEKEPFIADEKIAAIKRKHRAAFIGRTSFKEGWDALQEYPDISVIVIECEPSNEAEVVSFIHEVSDTGDYEIVVYSDSQDCLDHLVKFCICEPRTAILSDQVAEKLPEILGL